MKRILIVISIFLLLFLCCIYLFIPGTIVISQKLDIAVNRQALFRNLADDKNWRNWWPGERKGDGSNPAYLLNGLQYKLQDAKVLSLPLHISNKKVSMPVELLLVALNPDSVNIQINSRIAASYNPVTRIRAWLIARKIKKDLPALFRSISTYYAETKNLYGYDIQNKSVVDSILLINFKEMKGYPTINDIYGLVDELKAYIKQKGAAGTGNPMLNIFTKDSITYLLKVAIPVNKKLPPSGNMSYRWMLGGGNILITSVRGGNDEIQKALFQVQQYISDFQRIAPAIPFQSLVTDRRNEPDSSKWITMIYYPVM
jgi:hypothetical protein